MDLAEYKQNRIAGRERLMARILAVLKDEHPVAIHQFGSGIKGYTDEMSDIDVWATFRDEDIDDIAARRDEIFAKIDKVLIKSENPVNAPMGGKYSLVIFDTDDELYQADIYLARQSKTNIRPEAVCLYGSDELPRGEWVMDTKADPVVTLEESINQTITMAFIMIKAIARGGLSNPPIPEITDFASLNMLFDKLYSESNPVQKEAVNKIKDYAGKVVKFYMDSGAGW